MQSSFCAILNVAHAWFGGFMKSGQAVGHRVATKRQCASAQEEWPTRQSFKVGMKKFAQCSKSV